ncbi:rab-like protein 3 [Argiope bruennichi]|uniref:Rab-like protein 3 n=1 Tax=Argiope bruennichi TaxID=94029 RepID=A0A8T0E7V2_ARGBR|nr:rab-like protein 3 [Argiope bruennichi]KAF8767386.1 Rab-like protein 3 like protein [Argiope bruennichi]
MASIEKVKILVVGDSGVGKSSLVHLIAHSEAINNPSWTIGSSVEVKLHEYKEGTPFQKTYFIEMWDVGGSNSHQNTRHIFYNSYHGVILVHDLTNRKSKQNLRKWLAEVLSKDNPGKKNNGWYNYDSEQFIDNPVPVLVIGTKQDLAMEVYPPGRTKRTASIAEECGADEIYVDCRQTRSFAPGSSNAVKLSRYFDKVIEKKYQGQGGGFVSSAIDRRRLASYSNKQSHVD